MQTIEEKKQDISEVVMQTIEIVRKERKIYKNFVSNNAILAGAKLVEATREVLPELKDTIGNLLYKEIPTDDVAQAAWWYSVVIGIVKDRDFFYEFVNYMRANRKCFSKHTQLFWYYQMAYTYDANPVLYRNETKLELWNFFLEIVEEFAAEMSAPLTEIPEEERDEDLVLVIVMQYVEMGHAPTVTALDRCKVLQEKMGKRILLLNTGEALSQVGSVPCVGLVKANNLDVVGHATAVWKDTEIPYFQCKAEMPDVDFVNNLLLEIRQLAPKRVILVSGASVVGNLVNKMIPALTISTGFSDFAITGTRYQAIGRKLLAEDYQTLETIGFEKVHAIESAFTFDIKEQKEHVTRVQLGMPEDVFAMAVVSTRLDAELTDEFLQYLEDRWQDEWHLVFIGRFFKCEERMSNFPRLKSHMTNLGFCADVLSRLEVCDLYLNPKRKGGGSSVVEAMYLGKPVVSIDYGDVAINAGEDFCVEDYEALINKILVYQNDKDYYALMSEKARKRAEVLLDSESAFMQIMAAYDRRENERE